MRREYPHVIQVFKNSHFSPEIVQGPLARARRLRGPAAHRAELEPPRGPGRRGVLGEVQEPLPREPGARRRSASRPSSTPIAEVYASVFGPDPLEYRAERGLLDVHEEMGILLQEVVGSRVGKYFLPTFAGRRVLEQRVPLVGAHRARRTGSCGSCPGSARAPSTALSRRLPGPRRARPAGAARERDAGRGRPLRAAQGGRHRPGVRELRRRSSSTPPRERAGRRSPGSSRSSPSRTTAAIHRPYLIDWTSRTARLVVTFEGLLESTPFLARMRALLRLLREKTRGPVDIEFASDGRDLYLLQCRPQSFVEDAALRRDPARPPGREGDLRGAAATSRTGVSRTSRTSSTSTRTAYAALADPAGDSSASARPWAA